MDLQEKTVALLEKQQSLLEAILQTLSLQTILLIHDKFSILQSFSEYEKMFKVIQDKVVKDLENENKG